jgi:hypothetical protein
VSGPGTRYCPSSLPPCAASSSSTVRAAIAGYVGNPTAFNALGSQALTSFFAQLGCQRHLQLRHAGLLQQVCRQRGRVRHQHAAPRAGPRAHALRAHLRREPEGLAHELHVHARPHGKLRAAEQRGATDPLREPAAHRVGHGGRGGAGQARHRPLLHGRAAPRAGRGGKLSTKRCSPSTAANVAGLRAFIAPYSADAVAERGGCPAATIRGVAHEFASAESACVHMSTGVNMGRQGTLCYWLLHMLSFVTGNLDRPGGNLYSLGFYPAAKAGKLDLATSCSSPRSTASCATCAARCRATCWPT